MPNAILEHYYYVLYYLNVMSDIFLLFCYLNLRESTFESDCNGTRTRNQLVSKLLSVPLHTKCLRYYACFEEGFL